MKHQHARPQQNTIQRMKFSTLKKIQIGIDTTDERLRIVGVTRGAVLFETCDPHSLPELKRALASGDACTACVEPATTLVVPLKTPALPAGKIRKILPGLLDVQIPLPLSECSTAFVQYETACMAYAIRKSDLENHIKKLADQSCNPERLVPSTHAAWTLSLTEFPPTTADEARALFIAGPKQTVLITGFGTILDRQSLFKTTPEEPLRRLKLAFGGVPEHLVCIVSGTEHAQTMDALQLIAQGSQKTVKSVPSPNFFLARALAADGRSAGTETDTDLRQAAFPHPAVIRRKQRPALILAAAMIACAITLVGAALTSIIAASKTEAQARTALQNRLNTLADYPILTQGERAIQDVRAAMPLNMDKDLQHHIDDPLPNGLNTVATLCKKHDVTLQHLSLNSKGMKASARAKNTATINVFIQDLQTAGITTALTEPAKPDGDTGFSFFILPANP